MKHAIHLFMTLFALPFVVSAQDSNYEKKYSDQMGTRAPAVANMTEAASTAAHGAVYANRNASEFATCAWNFAPSGSPLRFEEEIQPLGGEELAHLKSTNTDGFIVLRNGTIIHEYYANGMHPTTKHSAYSTGKSWTSAAWHDVLLDAVDQRVEEILPELKGSVYGTQTVRHVIDMRSPVYWYEDYADPDSPVVISGSAMGWDFVSTDMNLPTFLKTLKKNPKLKDGDWYYVSSNTMIMGLLGRTLKGVHAYEGLRRFYDDLGLEHISGTIANLQGDYSAEGGQYFTLRDFVKLPHAVASGGTVNGKQVLSRAYLDDLFEADVEKKAAWKAGPYGDKLDEVSHYSNQWYIVDDDVILGIGSYGQYIVANRKSGVAIAKFSTYPKGQDYELSPKDVTWLIQQARSK